jgi:hypothetical protein
MPLTYLQTVEILYPNTTLVHYGQEPRPVAPEWAQDSSEHEAVQSDTCITVWWRDGLCEVYEPDGTVRRFWPKPTVADAVVSPPCDSSYYRFHTNGAVEEIYRGMTYYWGPTTLEKAPAAGDCLLKVVNHCEEPESFAYFNIYNNRITFALTPDSYLYNAGCECTDCFYERSGCDSRCYCYYCRDDDDYSSVSY